MKLYILIKEYSSHERSLHFGVTSRIELAEVWKMADELGQNKYIEVEAEVLKAYD